MFIIFGKKTVYKKLGYVADFCPICRDLRPFTFRRVGSAPHIYYLTVTEGELIGYQKICEHCKTAFDADINLYKRILDVSVGLEAMIQETYPGLRNTYGVRLEQEARIRDTPLLLSDEERMAQIRNVLDLLAPRAEAVFSGFVFDREVIFSLIAGFLILVLGVPMGSKVMPDHPDAFALIALAVAAFLLISQLATSGDRYVKRQLLPALCQSLHQLRPNRAELTRALDGLKRQGYKLGTKLTVEQVEQAMKNLK